MRSLKSLRLLIYLLLFAKSILSYNLKYYCHGENEVAVPEVDQNYLVNIHLKSNTLGHLIGTLIAPKKVLTSAAPVIDISLEKISVSFKKSASCPQLPYQNESIKVLEILFVPDYLPKSSPTCNDLAVICIDKDLTVFGASVAVINFNICSLCKDFTAKSATTFKCLTDSNGVEGLQAEQVYIQKGEDGSCPHILTDDGNICGPIGSPLFHNHFLVGIETSCRPSCAPFTSFICLIAYKTFLTPIIQDSLQSYATGYQTHDVASRIVSECQSEHDNIRVLNNIIDQSGVCPEAKKGLKKILEEFQNFNFKDKAFGNNIPQVLINEHHSCK